MLTRVEIVSLTKATRGLATGNINVEHFRRESKSRALEQDRMKSLFALGIGAALTTFAAWLTHVIVCLKAGAWGFLIAGAIFAPIGVVHGIGIWFGVW